VVRPFLASAASCRRVGAAHRVSVP